MKVSLFFSLRCMLRGLGERIEAGIGKPPFRAPLPPFTHEWGTYSQGCTRQGTPLRGYCSRTHANRVGERGAAGIPTIPPCSLTPLCLFTLLFILRQNLAFHGSDEGDGTFSVVGANDPTRSLGPPRRRRERPHTAHPANMVTYPSRLLRH